MSIFSKLFRRKEKVVSAMEDTIDEASIIADLIGCEYEQLNSNLTAEEVTDLYIKAYHEGKQAGYTPLIIVAGGHLRDMVECNYEDNGGAETYRSKLLSGDMSKGKTILKERFESCYIGYKEFNEEAIDIYGDFNDRVKPQTTFSMLDKKYCDKAEKLLLMKIPTDKSWQVFAWIPFGNWNECPEAEDLMSVCKYWYDLYGAVPAVLESDTLQMYVPEPIKDKDTALKLAKEQYGFCADIVKQGTGTIKALASTLLDSTVWFFWWD